MLRALAELPFLPSPESVVRAALDLAGLRPSELLVDLGCGDGRVLVIAARDYGAHAVGVELNPLLARLALREARLAGVYERVSVVHGDLFTFSVEPFDVVYCYPSPSVTRRLELKLRAECRRGCRVVVHDHPLPTAEPVETLTLPSGAIHVHTVYLYVAGVSWPVQGVGVSRAPPSRKVAGAAEPYWGASEGGATVRWPG